MKENNDGNDDSKGEIVQDNRNIPVLLSGMIWMGNKSKEKCRINELHGKVTYQGGTYHHTDSVFDELILSVLRISQPAKLNIEFNSSKEKEQKSMIFSRFDSWLFDRLRLSG